MKKLLLSVILIMYGASIHGLYQGLEKNTKKGIITRGALPSAEYKPRLEVSDSPPPLIDQDEMESEKIRLVPFPRSPSAELEQYNTTTEEQSSFRPMTPGRIPLEQSTQGLPRRGSLRQRVGNSPSGDYGSLSNSFIVVPNLESIPEEQRFSTSGKTVSDQHAISRIFNKDNKAEKQIGLICVHGTWSSNRGMGADANRPFSNALRTYAQYLADKNAATVTMIMPQWSSDLLTTARQDAANNIHDKLSQLNSEIPFDELYAIGHSHGCNVLLNLALIDKGSNQFNVARIIKMMTLIAAPRVEVTQFYNYPKDCFVYAFHSRNDATQQLGSAERRQGFEQRIPIRPEDIGHVYNIRVEYLPEAGTPNHKSIKDMSLIDCLPTIQNLIAATYKNYADLRLWIVVPEKNSINNPVLAINDPQYSNESDQKKKEIAETNSRYALEHLPLINTKFMQDTGYFINNLFWEIVTKQ
jgi:predicted esterase